MVLSNDESYEIINNFSSFITFEFEPVGKWFEQYNYLRHQGDIGLDEISESESSSEDEEEIVETPEYLKYLNTLDPKNWKDQDHYKVLGLENLRYKATHHQIKKAHKQKVLVHHPDKKKGSGVQERDIFTCITKAFEILSDPVKRTSFDSVDPKFKDDIPSVTENSKKNFYKVFGDAFEKNARWSIKKKVPVLGDENATFEQVNEFYQFWYDFDSWREFSYLDEESKETATDRDERRWIDKQNKAARAKLKKEETARIRQLVDNAYTCDPRILKFKQEEKRKKEEEKQKKKDAIRQRELELEKKHEEARLAKEKIEEEERQKIEAERKEKEQQKKLLKKERKTLRTTSKEFNYFTEDANERLNLLEKIETLIENLNLNDIQTLNESIQKSEDKQTTAKSLIFERIERLEQKETNSKTLSNITNSQPAPVTQQSAPPPKVESKEWCDDEIKLLVKAAQVIPIGTRDRWDVIANFIKEHSRGKYERTGKEVLAKTKDIQRLDPTSKEEANKKAYEKVLQSKKADVEVKEQPSERYISPAEQFLAEQGSNPAPWSTDEQKILEQALKTYPASLADRWEKISGCLPSRSKKDCMVRYKELVEIIQAKKRAQQLAEGKK